MTEIQTLESSETVRVADSPRRHRPDIDGLRAVAVLPVVAFHTGWNALRGGFVGVDVFFVISGFLIAGQLQSDLQAGSFSILRFYERRIRRIAPALLAMLIVVSAISAIALFPIDLYYFGESLLATVFSVSNIYFFAHSGYFGALSLSIPLIHTWSLAVEEQFYLLFPIVLLYVWRLSPRMQSAVLITLLLASFAASAISAFLMPAAAFYLPYSRAWELLLGAVLALDIVRCPTNVSIRNAMAVCGLILIAASIYWTSNETPFPGFAALPACVGAAMVIGAGMRDETMAGRFLSWRPLVFIGLISYSLYLWHWPLQTLQLSDRVFLPDAVPIKVTRVLIAIASIPIAYVSWKFVEQPFRDRSRISVHRLLEICGAAAAIVLVAGAIFVLAEGFPARIPSNVARTYAYLDYDPAFMRPDGRCFLTLDNFTMEEYDRARCLKSKGGRDYLLLGDSHAADLWFGLNKTLKGGNVHLAAAASCRPIIPVRGDIQCKKLMNEMYNDVLLSQRFAAVFVSARWSSDDLPRLATSMAWWKAHHLAIILIGPAPEYDTELPRLLAQSMLWHDSDLPQRHAVLHFADTDQKFARLAAINGIEYVSLYRALCPNGKCVERIGEVPVVFDGQHFTKEGSILAATKIEQANGFWK